MDLHQFMHALQQEACAKRLSESVARAAQRGAGISVRHPRRRQQGRTDDSRPHPAGNRSGTLHRGSVAVGPKAAEAYRMSGAETKNNSDNILSKIHIIMKIMCQEHYDKVAHYADQIGDKSLQQCLEKLKACELHSRRPCVIELYRDCAPYSFLFKQRYDDGSLGIVGGLVYHGSPDRSGCYTMNRNDHWQTHT